MEAETDTILLGDRYTRGMRRTEGGHVNALVGSALVAAIAFSLFYVLVAVSAPPASASTAFGAAADTYVDAANPTSSYGRRAFLRVDGSPTKIAFLRFDVQGVTDFSSATLSVYLESGSSARFDVRPVTDDVWDEATMTFASAPLVGLVVASSGPVSADSWCDLDVSSLVSDNGVVTVALTTDSPTAIRLSSREGANPPRLMVPGTSSPSADTQPPYTPGGLFVSSMDAQNPFQLELQWDSTTDNVGVVGYTVYRDGVPIATVEDVYAYRDTTVLPGTSYVYALDAYDAACNHSDLSDVLVVTTPPLPSAYALDPDADAYVNADKPEANYGSASVLRVDGSPDVRSYLRFTVRGVAAGAVVKRATLRLYTQSLPSAGCDAHAVSDDSWNEATITYANAPTVGSVAGSSGPGSRKAGWVEVDVTPLVSGNGTFSVALTTSGSTAISFLSRETAGPPELEIETGPPEPPPAAGILFADGFESGNLAQWLQTVGWPTVVGVVASQEVVKTGSWAARATSTGSTAAYAVAPLAASASEATFTTWLNILSQGANNFTLLSARRLISTPFTSVYVTATGKLATHGPDATATTTTSVGPGWHLLELHLVIGSTGGLIEVSLDGVMAATRTYTESPLSHIAGDPVTVVEIGDRMAGHIGDVAFDDVEVTAP
jgi:hypothetical protein